MLHAEFEGAGISDTLLGAQIALGLAVAAFIACLADALVGTILAVLLAILALLALLIGGIAGLNDTGSLEDVGLPGIETNDSNGKGADILGLVGRWVYDAGHNNEGNGWNEIHPIKQAQKLATWDGDWPQDIDILIKDWQERVAEASSPITADGQKKPQNSWQVHPLIDGCSPKQNGEPPVPK